VLGVQVDGVDAEALERRIARGLHVLGLAVDAEEVALGVAHDAELRGDDRLVATPSQSRPEQALVRPRAVHVGGVEEVHALVEGVVDERRGRRVVGAAIELGHAHAAEANGGDLNV